MHSPIRHGNRLIEWLRRQRTRNLARAPTVPWVPKSRLSKQLSSTEKEHTMNDANSSSPVLGLIVWAVVWLFFTFCSYNVGKKKGRGGLGFVLAASSACSG